MVAVVTMEMNPLLRRHCHQSWTSFDKDVICCVYVVLVAIPHRHFPRLDLGREDALVGVWIEAIFTCQVLVQVVGVTHVARIDSSHVSNVH
jgi:hypothetical protein